MSIIWTIIIASSPDYAKFLHPGPNEPSGFILTTILGIVGALVATYLGPRTFSTTLPNASALAAPACCLRAVPSFSTTEDQSVASAARCFSSACLLITFSIDLAHAAFAAGRPSGGSMIGVSGGMTTCKFVMGSLDRLSTRRLAVCAQAEHRKV